MEKPNLQKMKLLFLMEMLHQDSDEQHPLTTRAICTRLGEKGISCDRRTLAKDVQVLNEQGYEVMSRMCGHEKGYYVDDRSFSVPELKILIDAVQAASFITPEKSARMIEKIAALGGSHCAEILQGNMVCFNTRKHSNEAIYYNVDALETALQRKSRASFCYFDLDENRQRVYRKEKQRYVVDPVALVFMEDNYYLMCYTPKYRAITNYRVDRMDAVEVEEEAVCPEAIVPRENVAAYTEQMFKMFGGEKRRVTLQFDRVLIGSVYDKFGEEVRMRKTDEHTCQAEMTVQLSPTFWGWMFQFGDKMRLLEPRDAVEEFLARASAAVRRNDNAL